MQALIVAPNGTVAQVAATLAGGNWTATQTFTQAGVHAVVFVARDAAGNRRTSAGDSFMVAADPNVVELVSFEATAEPGGDVLLAWETASEIDVVGFNLYRVAVGALPQSPINPALIAATGSNGLGGSYTYRDRQPATGQWDYWLAAFDAGGGVQWFGPLPLTVSDPTAVQLVTARVVAGGGWSALALVGTALLRRSRRSACARRHTGAEWL